MSLRQNALILLLLTALLAIAGDWSGEPLLSRLWCVPAAALLLGLAYESWTVSRAAVRVQLQAPERWYLSRPTPIRWQIEHRLRGTLLLELAPAAAPEVTMERAVQRLPVAPDTGAAVVVSATARRLGRYQWPPLQTRVGGVLGLAWWPRRHTLAGEFQVLPEMVREVESARGAVAREMQLARRVGTGVEVLQLRDYRPGDPQRSIDWKASARLRRLVSRDFAENQQLDILIAVDSGRSSGIAAGDTDRLALYANVAARLGQRAVMLDDRVGLLIYAEQPLAAMPLSSGIAAVARMRSLLSQMTVRRGDANHALAAIRMRALARRRSLIVILTDLDDASLAGEMRSAVRLLLPTHLPVIAGVASGRIEGMAHTPADDELGVYRALAAQEYVTALTRSVSSLHALGAPAVLAAAHELDRAVIDAYLGFRRRRQV
jgi:uncharacterized protein (DUF58 family)